MSDKPPYEITDEADDDLSDIYRYTLVTFGDAQAIAYLRQLSEAFMMLSGNPRLGRDRSEFRKGLRSLVKNRHVIFYRVKSSRIRIVRVLAMTQDIQTVFK